MTLKYILLALCFTGVAASKASNPLPAVYGIPQTAVQAGSGRIKGVVTYHFNSNYGERADTGAKIFLISGTVDFPSDSAAFFYKDSIHLLRAGELAELNSAIQAHAKPPLLGKNLPILDKTSVDASGNFSLDEVPPGSYTVVIQSSHSIGRGSRDMTGRIKCISLEVSMGRAFDASWNFLPSAF